MPISCWKKRWPKPRSRLRSIEYDLELCIAPSQKEAAELQAIIDREGGNFKLESWDWWYYAEKLRKEKYALNETEIKPYFKMENVREGIFTVANKLYGLNFKK